MKCGTLRLIVAALVPCHVPSELKAEVSLQVPLLLVLYHDLVFPLLVRLESFTPELVFNLLAMSCEGFEVSDSFLSKMVSEFDSTVGFKIEIVRPEVLGTVDII